MAATKKAENKTNSTEKRGRPSNTEKIRELEKEIKELKQENEEIRANADGNLEYAKQVLNDFNRAQSDIFNKSHQTKDLVDTFANTLDAIDAMSRLSRKAVERDLTKEHNKTPNESEEK